MPQQRNPRSWIQAAKAWIRLLDSPKHGDTEADAQGLVGSLSDELSSDRGVLQRRRRADAGNFSDALSSDRGSLQRRRLLHRADVVDLHPENTSAINAQDILLRYVPGVSQSVSGVYQSGEGTLML